MANFMPLDLSAHFNASRDPAGWHPAVAADLGKLPAGAQRFWGVPFHLGPAEGPSWLMPQQGQAVTVPAPAGNRRRYVCDLRPSLRRVP